MDFKTLVRLLNPLTIEGVLKAPRSSHDRLVEKLHDLEFMTRSIVQTTSELTIELQILDADLLHQLLAGEANKFLLASRLSHDRSKQNQSDNASWQTVEHYYAAFYAIHYLIRITGVSLTNLDSRATDEIQKNYLTAVTKNPIPEGLYTLRYNNLTKTLTLIKKTKKRPGGSHQEVWQLWLELIEKLSIETSTDITEYLGASIDLAEHKAFIVKSDAKFNPPEIRGEINYQFRGGAWIFEKNANNSIRRLQNAISDSNFRSSHRAPSPEGLVSSTKLIIGLATAVFLSCSEKYPKGICRSLANKYSKYIS
jgi:hypothetical protein